LNSPRYDINMITPSYHVFGVLYDRIYIIFKW
jgi:hypothetical protein